MFSIVKIVLIVFIIFVTFLRTVKTKNVSKNKYCTKRFDYYNLLDIFNLFQQSDI